MRLDIPMFKRCCFCLPLRYGLLGWGYFKMATDAFFVTYLTSSIIAKIMLMRSCTDNIYRSRVFEDLVLPMIADAVLIVDFMATIMFIVGGHKKSVKLMRVFFFRSIAMFMFTLTLTATSVVLTIQDFMLRNLFFLERTMLMFSFYFMVLVVQTYFLILLRSEIIKLWSKSKIIFPNNATEVKCIEKCEELREEEEEMNKEAT
ncbi:hypothetical protein PYW08_011581 [Mythimna loreyi]|uniref:Uncharacterized protein n=1 Tax=Mythimna loreyi TaxID=667449 RepID=A0ACC2QNU0_9NEOP|nr:hypothetical protein PYW08_011581 [Mythimna loreyi]